MRIALTAQIESLRKTLHEALQDQFNKELERGISEIRSNVAPYTRFVELESKQLVVSKEKLTESLREIESLTRQTETMFKSS